MSKLVLHIEDGSTIDIPLDHEAMDRRVPQTGVIAAKAGNHFDRSSDGVPLDHEALDRRVPQTGVIPAKAGIHFDLQKPMDSRFRGNDDLTGGPCPTSRSPIPDSMAPTP
jgi:hypothetical protein